MPPRVELLWWAGCPSTPAARAMLDAALSDAGIDRVAVEQREVTTDEQAEAEGFVGSPTIRVDGRDVVPAPPGEPTGLTCRVYRLRDGRFSPTPDPEDLREAVAHAVARARRAPGLQERAISPAHSADGHADRGP